MAWWMTVSKVKEVKGKVLQYNSLSQLFEKISPEQLQVPQFILDFDYGVSLSSDSLNSVFSLSVIFH